MTAKALASGWQLNGVLVLSYGEPFTVSAATTSLNTPGSSQTSGQVVQIVNYIRNTAPGQSWAGPLAFKPVTESSIQRPAGCNILRGLGTVNLDLGIFRPILRTSNNPGANLSNMVLNADVTVRSLGGYTEITSVKDKEAGRNRCEDAPV